MVAEKVMNGKLNRVVGTVSMDTSVAPEMRAAIGADVALIEERTFKAHNRYLPIRLTILSKNPQLTQNEGYR
jgi:hypothetical protein